MRWRWPWVSRERFNEDRLRLVRETERLEVRHQRELEALEDAHTAALAAWRETVVALQGAIAADREDRRLLEKTIVALKREGFFPPAPAGAAVEEAGLPDVVLAAIEEVAYAPDIRTHLERYAWERLEAKVDPRKVAEEIRRGEEPPSEEKRSRTRVVNGRVEEVGDDAPVRVMDGDDELEDDEDQEDDDDGD